MWTVHSEIITADPGLHTHRLVMSVEEVKPFTYSEEVYEQVSSVPDMHLLPEDVGTLNRRDAIDLVFRNSVFATEIEAGIQADLTKLYTTYHAVIEVTDEILFSNGPSQGSSSTTSEGVTSSSSTEIDSTSSSSSISNSSRSSLTESRSSSSSSISSASTMETSTSVSSSSDSSESSSSDSSESSST